MRLRHNKIFEYIGHIFNSPGLWPIWAYFVALGRLACGVRCLMFVGGVWCKPLRCDPLPVILNMMVYIQMFSDEFENACCRSIRSRVSYVPFLPKNRLQ